MPAKCAGFFYGKNNMAYSNPDQAASLLQSDQASGVQDIINTANKPNNLPEEVEVASASTVLKGILKGGKESDLAVKVAEKEALKEGAEETTEQTIKQVDESTTVLDDTTKVETEVKPELEIGGATKVEDTVNLSQPTQSNVDDVLTKYNKSDILDNGLSDFNAGKLNTEEDVLKLIEAQSQVYKTTMDAAKRAEMSNEATRQLADILGMSEKKLANKILGRKEGELFNSETMLASRDLLVSSISKLDELAKIAVNGTDADKLAFAQHMAFTKQLQAQVKGAQTEIARALQSFNIKAKAGGNVDIEGFLTSDVLKTMGGADEISGMADAYLKLPRADQKAKFASLSSGWTRGFDALYEAWINILLSSPVSHVRNIVGNAVTTYSQGFERGWGYYAGKPLNKFLNKNKNADQGLAKGENEAMAFAIRMNWLSNVKLSAQAFKTGDELVSGSKLEQNYRPKAFSGEGIENAWLAKSANVFGNIFTLGRVPTKMLQTQDAFFKAQAYQMEVYAQAWRSATEMLDNGKLLPDEAADYMADFIVNPPANVVKDADALAKYITFQSELGSTGKAVQTIANKPVVRYFLPFTKTPINIAKYAIERTPVGFMLGKVQDDIAAGGVRAEMAYGRMAMGTTFMGAMMTLAQMGYLTGNGSPHRGIQLQLKETGYQKNSFKLGDTYYSYSGFDPFAMLISMSADLSDLASQNYIRQDDWDEIVTGFAYALGANLTNKTYMEGMSNFLELLSDPTRHDEATINKFIKSFVPRIAAQINRGGIPFLYEGDPTKRNTDMGGAGDVLGYLQNKIASIKSQVPLMSETLEPSISFWGEEIVYDDALGPNIVSPIMRTKVKDNPVAEEMVKLKMNMGDHSDNFAGGIPFSKKPKVINGEKIDSEYTMYRKYVGKLAYQNVLNLIQDSGYNELSRGQKINRIEQQIYFAREVAKNWMMTSSPYAGTLQDLFMESQLLKAKEQ